MFYLLKILRIHERNHQRYRLALFIKPPVSAINAVSHTAGKERQFMPCPRDLPMQEVPALILDLGMFLIAVCKKRGEIVVVLILSRILTLPPLKKFPVFRLCL